MSDNFGTQERRKPRYDVIFRIVGVCFGCAAGAGEGLDNCPQRLMPSGLPFHQGAMYPQMYPQAVAHVAGGALLGMNHHRLPAARRNTRAAMSSARQAVVLGPSFTGLGKRPH